MSSSLCHFIIDDMTGEDFGFVVEALSYHEILGEILKKNEYSFKLFLSKPPEVKCSISFMYVK